MLRSMSDLVKGRMVALFSGRGAVQLMGWRASDGGSSPPMGELEESLRLVLEHLERIKPGAMASGEAGLRLRCVAGQGIVLRAPMCEPRAYGGNLRGTPAVRLSSTVAALIDADPVGEQMMEVLRDEYEWGAGDAHVYSFGQGNGEGQVFRMEIVSDAPGPEHKHLRYTARTVAELACFLDFLLGTYVWDSICAD